MQALEEQERRYIEFNTLLKEELAWFKAQVYGRSSEKSSADVSPDQSMLFNEPEVLSAIASALGTEADAVITIEEYQRKKKPGKKAIPAGFPRIPVVHDITEAEKICPHDGTQLVVIGHESAERYDYVSPQLRVLVDKRLKYACPCCHQGVKIAPLPPRLLPKSQAGASLLAHITTAKYIDGLPLTRQSRQLERLSVNIGPGTLALWMNTIGAEKLPPLIALMHESALAEPVEIRRERSAPMMEAFKSWVDELLPTVPPKSTLGKALSYTVSQWTKITRFLEHPDVPAHNNRVENDIRPFAVGRRAWLFIDTQLGALASANLYSLAITCRANGINALAYFTYLYERLPFATTATELESLLPWNVKPLLAPPPKI